MKLCFQGNFTILDSLVNALAVSNNARIRPVEIKRRLFICEPPLCRNSALAVTYQPPGTQRDGRCELKWLYGHSEGNTGPGRCSQMVP